MSDLSQQLQFLLKEIKEIKSNQLLLNNKIEKMQNTIDNLANNNQSDDFDFEIVCPYCENEFLISADSSKNKTKCPICKNIIEIDWSGNLDEDSHGCGGCQGCGKHIDEDDDM